jgi:acetyl-CoA acetyltransferase
MEQRSVVVVGAKRTPMGRFMGAFADVPAVDLGIAAARAALDAAGVDPGRVDETVAGHGRQAGNGPNPGRQVSIRAGVPETVPAYTVNKACGSSAKALTLAAGSIILGEIDVALVVGMENMTRTPYLLRGMRGGYRMGPAVIEDAMSSDGFMDPLARVAGWASAGVDPHIMGWGVVPATQKLLTKLGWTLPEIDVVEVNEAFAAQILACDRELKFDWERTNVNGGAIALGHPIGMTGARIVGTVVHQLQRQGARRGLATLCISGGQGMAVALERVDA